MLVGDIEGQEKAGQLGFTVDTRPLFVGRELDICPYLAVSECS